MADETKKSPEPSAEAAKSESGKVATTPPAEGTKVKFSEKMWVESTGTNKHMKKKGEKFEVQKLHGERLIKMGAAIATTAPEKKKEDKKK